MTLFFFGGELYIDWKVMSITQALFNILIAIHTVLSLKPASDQKVVLDSHHHLSDNV